MALLMGLGEWPIFGREKEVLIELVGVLFVFTTLFVVCLTGLLVSSIARTVFLGVKDIYCSCSVKLRHDK
jgi:hypothetical protein